MAAIEVPARWQMDQVDGGSAADDGQTSSKHFKKEVLDSVTSRGVIASMCCKGLI